MIFLKTEDEIELMRAANLLVADTLTEIAKNICPGVTTKQLDALAACTYSFSRILRICALKIRERAATFPIAIAITVS